ncbi:MAG: WG repeat-containing protein [Acutalibacteraceae bacterium]
MKKTIIIFLLLFTACSVKTKGEQFSYQNSPVKFRNNQKYGLFNPVTKEVIIEPKYTYIENYSKGFCLGVIGEEGGYCDVLDTSGNILYSYKTEPLSCTYCYNGFFYFVNDSNENYYHGLYNYKGEQVFKSNFIYSMNNECIVTRKKSDYIFLFFDSSGIKQKKILLPDTYPYEPASNVVPKYEAMYEPFSNGFARFYIINNDKKLFGMIKENRTVVISPKYKSLGKEFVEGVVIAENENSLYGLLNKEGNWTIQPKYEKINNYSGKVLSAKSGNWKIIDLEENILKSFPANLEILSDFFNDIAIFSITIDDSIKYGLIDSYGDFVLNAVCKQINHNPDNGYWQVLIDNKWMLFKADEGILNPEEYLDFSKVK